MSKYIYEHFLISIQVHFRSGIGGDAKIILLSKEIMVQLDELGRLIKDKSRQLEDALSQIEAYQQNITGLRQKIIQEEQKLRVILSPTYMAQNKEGAATDEEVSVSEQLTSLLTFIIHHILYLK